MSGASQQLSLPSTAALHSATKSTTQPQKILLFFSIFSVLLFCFFWSQLQKPEARSQKPEARSQKVRCTCTMTVTFGGACVRTYVRTTMTKPRPDCGVSRVVTVGPTAVWCTLYCSALLCKASHPLHHEIFKRSKAGGRAGGRAVITLHLFLKS